MRGTARRRRKTCVRHRGGAGGGLSANTNVFGDAKPLVPTIAVSWSLGIESSCAAKADACAGIGSVAALESSTEAP